MTDSTPALTQKERDVLVEDFPNIWEVFQLMQHDIQNLKAELAKHQESEFHPDWSMLKATRESLREHQDELKVERKRVAELERWQRAMRRQPESKA